MLHLRIIIISFFIIAITTLSYSSNYDDCLCNGSWKEERLLGTVWSNTDNYEGVRSDICNDQHDKTQAGTLLLGTDENGRHTFQEFSNTAVCEVCTDTDSDSEPPAPDGNSTISWHLASTKDCDSSQFPLGAPDLCLSHNNSTYGTQVLITHQKIACCGDVERCYVSSPKDNNQTTPDENQTDPNSCPQGEAKDSNGNCMPDTDDDGIPDTEDDTPNGDTDTHECKFGQIWRTDIAPPKCACVDGYSVQPYGAGQSKCQIINRCDSASEIFSTTLEECVCKVGFHKENILSNTGNCIKDDVQKPVCPVLSPSDNLPLQGTFSSASACQSKINQNHSAGGTGGSWIDLPESSGKVCCYYRSVTPPNPEESTDNCDHPEKLFGLNFSRFTDNPFVCDDTVSLFDCDQGKYACYVNPSSQENNNSNNNNSNNNNNNSDQNNTGSGGFPNRNDDNSSLGNRLSLRLSTLSNDIKNNTKTLGDKLDTIQSSIDNIGKPKDGMTSTDFVPKESNITFSINEDRVKKINEDIGSLYEKIEESKGLIESVKDEFATFSTNIENSYTSLTTDYERVRSMFDNKPTVSVPSGGSCNLSAAIFGGNIEFATKMCKFFSAISPAIVFIFSISTQLALIYLSILLFKKD